MTTVALYARVSTSDQDLEGQLRDLEAEAARRGWPVGSIYCEKVSARGTVERVDYDRLLRDATLVGTRKWDRVLVWSLDRWSRDPSFVNAVGSIERLEVCGVKFHSLKEPFLDSSEDGSPSMARDVLRALLPVIAAFESKRRSERVRVAMREIAEGRRPTRSGRPNGRPLRATAERVAEASRLRDQGLGWPEIAHRVGLKASTARRAVARAATSEALGGRGRAKPVLGQKGLPPEEGGR